MEIRQKTWQTGEGEVSQGSQTNGHGPVPGIADHAPAGRAGLSWRPPAAGRRRETRFPAPRGWSCCKPGLGRPANPQSGLLPRRVTSASCPSGPAGRSLGLVWPFGTDGTPASSGAPAPAHHWPTGSSGRRPPVQDGAAASTSRRLFRRSVPKTGGLFTIHPCRD